MSTHLASLKYTRTRDFLRTFVDAVVNLFRKIYLFYNNSRLLEVNDAKFQKCD